MNLDAERQRLLGLADAGYTGGRTVQDGLAAIVRAQAVEIERLRAWQEAVFVAHPNIAIDAAIAAERKGAG